MPDVKKLSNRFIGCGCEYKDAQIVMFGAPFDSTTSCRPGTRYAFKAMRNESGTCIETYSPYLDKDLTEVKVCDDGELEIVLGNSEKTLKIIEDYTSQILSDGKIPFMIGGEHLVTLGTVRAAVKKYPDICIVHFDAHTDLRDEFFGEKLSHATVIRRAWDLVGDKRIHQFGIRSGDRTEFIFGKEHNYFTKHNFHGLENSVELLKGKPVYLTIDVDVLDPSQMPGTGTPEAGGVTFLELIGAIQKLSVLNIVGCDINELSPVCDQSGASTILACKLTRELLLSISK